MNELEEHLNAIRVSLGGHIAAIQSNANRVVDVHLAAKRAAEKERDELKRRNNDLAAEIADGKGSGMLAMVAGFLFGGFTGFVVAALLFK